MPESTPDRIRDEQFPAEWTVYSLHSYISRVLLETDRRIEVRFEAMQRAVDIAQAANDAVWQAERERIEQRFTDQDKGVITALATQEKAVEAAMAAQEKAVLKAEAANETRFHSVNEFRAALNDQSKTLISRSEVESRIASLSDKVDANSHRMDRNEGQKQGVSIFWGALIAGGGLLIAAASVVVSMIFHAQDAKNATPAPIRYEIHEDKPR